MDDVINTTPERQKVAELCKVWGLGGRKVMLSLYEMSNKHNPEFTDGTDFRGYTLKQVARHLGMTYEQVTRIVRKLAVYGILKTATFKKKRYYWLKIEYIQLLHTIETIYSNLWVENFTFIKGDEGDDKNGSKNIHMEGDRKDDMYKDVPAHPVPSESNGGKKQQGTRSPTINNERDHSGRGCQ